MKLESLKSSKFEAFKGSELQELMAVMGGATDKTIDNCIDHKADYSYNNDGPKQCTTVAAGDTATGPGPKPIWF